MTQQPVRLVELAVEQQHADARGGYGTAIGAHQFMRVNRAAHVAPPFLQRRDRARRACAEPEVVADVHMRGRAFRKRRLEELFGAFGIELLVEGDDDDVIDAE